MTVVAAPASVDRTWSGLASVSMLSTPVSSLICAGWLPQDGLFCWSGSLSSIERDHVVKQQDCS